MPFLEAFAHILFKKERLPMKRKFNFLITLPFMALFFGAFTCKTLPAAVPEDYIVLNSPLEYPEHSEYIKTVEIELIPPVIEVTLSAERFSLFGLPADNLLEIGIQASSQTPIKDWQIQIFEPHSPHLLFHKWSGNGHPPKSVSWDGRNSLGEPALSASVYPFSVTVTDINGNYSVYENNITTDILVVTGHDNHRRIRVPSLVFAPNSASLTAGLSPEVIAYNEYVLRAVATALNRLGNYRVRIDGHTDFSYGITANVQRPQQQLLDLSRQRALTVFHNLVRLGVNQIRLSNMGMGSAHPLASFDDADNRWKNNRIEFVLLRW